MKDFQIDDRITTFLVTPKTVKAVVWASKYFANAVPERDGPGYGYVIPPGFLAHKMLPEIREAGLTVDGDVDENGNIRLRVQT